MQSVRTVVRTLIAVFLATAAPVLAAPAVRAHAQEVQQQSFRTNSAGSGQLTISVDGVSPSYATPTATITVRGTVTNDTGSPVTGVQVQLLSSSVYFQTRSQMDSYTAGHDTLLYLAPEGTSVTLPGTLHSGKTARWSASFTAASVGYSQFGVYPLAAQAEYPDGAPLAIDRTLLPYWPGNGAAKPLPLNVAWIWPLIDAPQQGMCGATLATNSLAGSLAAGGRLGTLLDAGQQWAAQDDLTWAVDPALLSDVNVMTSKYAVGGSSTCHDRQYEPPSVAAAQWLSLLRASTSTEPMLFTPYADADVAALTRAGLQQITRTAYHVGESVAATLLPRQASVSVAWPADGAANASTLTSLAHDGGASTVVLNSGQLPSSDGQYDNALNATTVGDGTAMGVLLADSGITGLLGSVSASSPARAQFDAAQDFLADTAMILAEAPYLQRSLVIAPPRHWDPSAAEAGALLSMTYSAPWLHKTGLSSLAAAAARLSARAKVPASAPSGALSAGYTDQVAAAHASAALYKDLLYRPGPNVLNSVDAAVAATTSVAWRGAGAAGGEQALINLSDNLRAKEQKVSIITGKKILLAGTSGTTPVSVQNLLPVAVQVRVVATPSAGSQLSVSKFVDLIRVPAGQTGTVRVPLHSSAITTTTMQLQLQTKDGSPLTWTSQLLSVQATRYGRALLVLIAAALGVLVLTSVARWIRRWLNDGRNDTKADGRSGGTG
jgi:hypothetical protein